MALADTARLIASLELQDKFSKNAALYDRTVAGLERRTAGFDRLGQTIGRGLGTATHNIALLGVAAGGVIAASVKSGIDTLERLETVTAQTNAVIASTQGVAGQTTESIRKLAEKYEGLNALIDDKVIQSGENLLLTFTNVKDDAFEPALEAALNLNQALGGGEEGLQGTIIQVGKALSDPIRGLTNLRRVGVVFTKDQEKQIRALVDANDLYGAQRVILAELSKEFGGSFAAAGDTAAGKFAKLHDAIEDAQASLATALLPVLGRVSDKLTTFLSDPKTIAGIETFGQGLADGFDKVVEFAGKVPWETIGSSLQIAGTGAKAVLDAFMGLPDWVQTAVLTGWGLNKLTGGALTGIVGDIGKIAFGGGLFGRGSSAANPVWVQSATGGVGGPGGPGGLPLLGLGLGPILLGAATIALVAAGAAFALSPDRSPEFGSLEGRGGPGRNPRGVPVTDSQLGEVSSQFKRSRATSEQLLTLSKASSSDRRGEAAIAYEKARVTAANTAEAARWTGLANANLTTLNSKDLSPNVKVDVTAISNISVNPLQRTLTSFRIAGSGSVGGFTESAF